MSAVSNAVSGLAKRPLKWSIVLSIFLIVAGVVAIIIPPAASIAVTVFTGWVLVFSGVVHLFYAWHTRDTGGIVWELLLGVLYIATGVYLLWNPVLGIAALTLALAVYLFVEAVLEFILSYHLRHSRGWGWLLFDGVITVLLSGIIWMTWPIGSVWVLGTIVGISMFFSGITRLMISLTARKLIAGTV